MAQKDKKRKFDEYDKSDYNNPNDERQWQYKDGKITKIPGVEIIEEDELGIVEPEDQNLILKIMEVSSALKSDLDNDVKMHFLIDNNEQTGKAESYVIEICFSHITQINILDIYPIVAMDPYKIKLPTIYYNERYAKIALVWMVLSHNSAKINIRKSWLFTSAYTVQLPLDDGNDSTNIIRRANKKPRLIVNKNKQINK